MSSIPIDTDGFLYDAQLTRIEPESGSLIFTVGGCEFSEPMSTPAHWRIGQVGRLRLGQPACEFAFHAYFDQRLRRDPLNDDPDHQRWGWRVGEQSLQVRAGILPGLNGAVVTQDTQRLELDLPGEFLDLCSRRGVSPVRVLRAYVADLCELFNWARCPREDGYSTNGSDERMYAQMHFHRTFD